MQGWRSGGLLAAIALVLFVAGCSDPNRSDADPIAEALAVAAQSSDARRDVDFSGRVTRIVDGDTFWISGQDVRIRVWALDAPEVREAAGSAATATLTRLIAGQTLQCRQRDIDRYGRIVGQCWLPDGRDITAAMIASGTASEYCRFSRNHYGTC
jgi:endonuclease YncB( thermonuclease family)